jgi:hypothetical protein
VPPVSCGAGYPGYLHLNARHARERDPPCSLPNLGYG